MKPPNPAFYKFLLILSLATSHLYSTESFTARSVPAGPRTSSFGGGKWEKALPTQSIKIGDQLEFLAGIADHSKLLYSLDKKTYWLLDLKTGKKKEAFSQTEGASWAGAKGNTLLTRVGFGEQYVFRTFPDFKASPLWSPPNGAKANGFAFGSRCNDFLCLTTDKSIHQFSLSSLRPRSKPFAHENWKYINGRPFDLWSMQKKGIHLKESSSDLKVIAVGKFLYRKDATGSKQLTQFVDSPGSSDHAILSGDGHLLDPRLELGDTVASAPSSNIVVGGARNPPREMRFTFADTSRNQRLFSVGTDLKWSYKRKPEVQQLIYCKSLNKLVVSDAENGIVHVIDVNVDAFAKVYPIQLSKQDLEVDSLDGFSYQPSFSRGEFIESYSLKYDNQWEIDAKSGRITPKDHLIKGVRKFAQASFIAKLKGGGSVSGFVAIKIQE